MDSPSGRAPTTSPRWDLVDTEGCGGGIRFFGAPGCFCGTWIYIGGRSRSVEQQGAREGGGRAPYWACAPISWAPRASTDLLLPPIYTHVPREHQKRARKTTSTAVTFCIRDIPSWGLFRSSAGGGIDHGGLLHQHHSPSDDV